jgi:hypothetical protein
MVSLTLQSGARRVAIALATAGMLAWAAAATADSLRAPTAVGDEIFQPSVGQSGKDVIWVPTDDELVRVMLEAANVTPDDVVYDLGAGDGKIAIAAARDFGARSVGIEYNPDMAALAQRNVERSNLTDRVRIIRGDIFEEDFSEATVVTLYLLPHLNIKLRPTLLDMPPGTRIVSNSFDMQDWRADEVIGTEFRTGYFWIVPAKVAGQWGLQGMAENDSIEVELSQRYQEVDGTVTVNGVQQPLIDPTLRGDNLSFAYLDTQGNERLVELKVAGDRMAGQMNNAGVSVAVSAARLQ